MNGPCRGLDPIVRIIKHGLMPIVQIGIPLLLIVLATLDLGKAVVSSDDKEVKAAQSRLIKRVIYAVLIFFVVTIVTLVMNLVAAGGTDANTTGWAACWNSI